MGIPGAYKEHKGKVIETDLFEHVMALALNPKDYSEGLIRCITRRKGTLGIKGAEDWSILSKVRSVGGLERYELAGTLKIKNEEEIVDRLISRGLFYIGPEDPDIFFDSENGLYHVYFTIPLINRTEKPSHIHLGHASGKNLDSLEMTAPVLSPTDENPLSAKELSLSPVNKKGIRLNLIESSDRIGGTKYSVIRRCIARNFDPPWEFGQVVFHPTHDGYKWCAGHASPGPLFPKSFIDIGKNKLVGIMNGREANKRKGDKTIYGVFSVGLFIYDFEKGKVDWVSKEPFIIDSEAKIITFASQFVQTDKKTGILYAHVDDSFVRAYTLYADAIRQLVD